MGKFSTVEKVRPATEPIAFEVGGKVVTCLVRKILEMMEAPLLFVLVFSRAKVGRQDLLAQSNGGGRHLDVLIVGANWVDFPRGSTMLVK